jgi:predicted 2-oxoglutarate/Fe(II)-dependent dioxygenase YbiX
VPACHWLAEDIATVDDLLSSDECDAYVRFSESVGYSDAPITTARGPVMAKEVRNNERVMVDDADRAAELWRRAAPLVPEHFGGHWRAVGLNERLRFYRYEVGQMFNWHYDGAFSRDSSEESHFTFMVYLNDDFEGGETVFARGARQMPPNPTLRVKPRKGQALLFHHPILHKGDTVSRGRKYVLRTDVMYRLEG